MSPRSIRNATSDKLDGASDECLSVKENAPQTGGKVELLKHGSFVTFFFFFGRANRALCRQQYLSKGMCACV